MMFAGAAGFLLLVIAAILVVQALATSRDEALGTLTISCPHALQIGDSIHVPGAGLCVVTEVVDSRTVRYEPQHVQNSSGDGVPPVGSR